MNVIVTARGVEQRHRRDFMRGFWLWLRSLAVVTLLMLLLLFLPILLLREIAGVSTYARRMQPSPSLELSFAKVSSQSWSTAVQLLRWERDMSSSMARRVLYLFACPPKSVPVYLCSGLESELEGLMGKDFGREGEGDRRSDRGFVLREL